MWMIFIICIAAFLCACITVWSGEFGVIRLKSGEIFPKMLPQISDFAGLQAAINGGLFHAFGWLKVLI